MKTDIIEKIEFPENIEFEIKENEAIVKYEGKEIRRRFNLKNIDWEKQGNILVIGSKKATKNELKLINTIVAHIKNMIKGMKEKFVYKLEIAFVHFPMNVKIDEAKKAVIISNFLGEKKSRVCNIIDGTEVDIDGRIITVESHNKELAGQMAANLEKATAVRKKDLRKFQDGIYITEKCGKEI